MKIYIQFLIVSLLLINLTVHAQKKVVAKYNGGHIDVDIALTLYADSTYELIERSGSIIPSKSVRKGVYLINDSSITLYNKKRLHFLFYKLQKKYHENTYRIRGKHILMFSETQEFSKDGDFIKAYNTLTLE